MFIEPTKIYASLSGDGTSKQFPGGAAFWSLPMQELERVLLAPKVRPKFPSSDRRTPPADNLHRAQSTCPKAGKA
jgi:hypothetical protein